MISSGRYLYHLQDIADIEYNPSPGRLDAMRLSRMKSEAAEFEAANPDEAKEMQERAKELADQ